MPPDTNRPHQDEGHQSHSSHLFTLRLWPAARGDDQIEWRGKVEHVTSGEAHFFRAWPTLIEYLERMLAGSAPEQAGVEISKADNPEERGST